MELLDLARDPNTSASVVDRLTRYKGPMGAQVRVEALANPKLPVKTIRREAENMLPPDSLADPDMPRKRAVAINPHTPPEILHSLSKSKDSAFLKQLLLNPSLDTRTVTELSYNPQVMYSSMVHPNVSKDRLQEISEDGRVDFTIRKQAEYLLKECN